MDDQRLATYKCEACRIVVTDLQGNFVDQIGGNGQVLRDGSFEEAGFSRPQGLAFASSLNALYVADTENHALRKVPYFSVSHPLQAAKTDNLMNGI